jgi:3-methyladenine DNA glycosylase AlkD
MTLRNLKNQAKKASNPKRKKTNEWFFKTGKGQYGEGDKFIGISMPDVRIIAKDNLDLSIKEVEKLLQSAIHEHRMIALVIWTYQYEKADEQLKKKIYKTYLKNTKKINNWDLVDVTTPNIMGKWLLDKKSERKLLYKLAKSKSLWEKRIAILATYPFIRNKDFRDTLKLAKLYLNESHDLMHKATGWMLREIGKKQEKALTKFLDKHYKIMPRTMLRYSIERLSIKQRWHYMKK